MYQHHDSRPDFYAFLGVFGGLYLFYKGFQDLKLERLIAGTAMSKVRSVAVGAVELSGVARPWNEKVCDPIFGQECCYYDIVVKQLRSNGKSSYWATLNRSTSVLPFHLEDDTGKIQVYPDGAQCFLKKAVDVTLRGGLLFGGGAAAADPVEVYARGFGGGELKVEAVIVRESEEMFVYGFAGPDQGSSASIVVRKPEDGAFVISDEPQAKLAWDLEWRSALMIFGGPALTIVCAAYLAFSFRAF